MNFEKLLLAFLCLLFITNTQAQQKITGNKKGDLTVLWGWNRGWYSNSDIHFKGDNYDFTLSDVVAKDRQTKFDPAIYFHPHWITIPQTNFRIEYFHKENYSMSLGVDHMKYVVQQNQNVAITGSIEDSGIAYDGDYNNETINIEDGFLRFEHSDGLNYINFEYRRFDNLVKYENWNLNIAEGLGTGFLLPRTNATLFNNKRHDKFHLAGYGFSAVVALNLSYKRFFIQSELKGGFINMPDMRTTEYKSDRASQHFFFSQLNFLVGYSFSLNKD
ncbi:MAG: Uncharacterised protein [Cryomorphaceae bacterium]|nr:MAG: Uncharacterised protein [Cryomorphaceae bacterium]